MASRGPIKAVILTSSSLRHDFFRLVVALTPGIEVVRSYCERDERGLSALVAGRPEAESSLQRKHLVARENSERDFFGAFVKLAPDRSNSKWLSEGAINDDQTVAEIERLQPEILISYGCSLVKSSLLQTYSGRFLNVHLGLSPYYRGSGTNFWPLVRGEPEFVGATFMHIDPGIDTGEVVHQIRARVFPGDTPHMIGNRLITDMSFTFAQIVLRFRSLVRLEQLPKPDHERVYRMRDMNERSLRDLSASFAQGMVGEYLKDLERRQAAVPILRNPALEGWQP